MHKKLTEWFRWRRVFSRQTRLLGPQASASSRMFEIRASIWRKVLLRLER